MTVSLVKWLLDSIEWVLTRIYGIFDRYATPYPRIFQTLMGAAFVAWGFALVIMVMSIAMPTFWHPR